MLASNYTLRLTTDDDAKPIYRLMMKSSSCLLGKTLFPYDDIDYIQKYMNSYNGFGVVAINPYNELIGSLIVRYPGMSTSNFGNKIGMNDSELKQVVHLELIHAKPEYDSKSIKKSLITFAESAINQEKYNFLMTFIAENNIEDRNVFKDSGYKCVMHTYTYGELLKYTYLKRISNDY